MVYDRLRDFHRKKAQKNDTLMSQIGCNLQETIESNLWNAWLNLVYIYIYEQGSKDAMKGFNYDPPSLLKICDLLCVAIGGLM